MRHCGILTKRRSLHHCFSFLYLTQLLRSLFLQPRRSNSSASWRTFAKAGKKWTCPPPTLSSPKGEVHNSFGVWVSLKYTRIGISLLGKKSQFTNLSYVHRFGPPSTKFSPCDLSWSCGARSNLFSSKDESSKTHLIFLVWYPKKQPIKMWNPPAKTPYEEGRQAERLTEQDSPKNEISARILWEQRVNMMQFSNSFWKNNHFSITDFKRTYLDLQE